MGRLIGSDLLDRGNGLHSVAAFPNTELAAMLFAARSKDGTSFTSLYESELAIAYSTPEAVAVSSDSATVTVICGALGLERGCSVLVMTRKPRPWVVGALRQAGVDLVFLSEDKRDGPVGIFAAVLCDTKGAVDSDVPHAKNVADRLGCPLLLDLTSHSDLPEIARRFSQIADISFFASDSTKRLSTGEGGVLLFRNAVTADRARSFAQFGRLDGIQTGVNHKLSPVQAALGSIRLRGNQQLDTLPELSQSCVGLEARTITRPYIPDRFDSTSPNDERELAEALAYGLDGESQAVNKYESSLAATFDAPHAIAVSSGYAAVLVALAALDLQPGDEVLLTPTCPLCTVFALTALGVIPVFCDTRTDGFSINLDQAGSRIGPRTRAILEIPMWGYPVPAHEVGTFAREHGLAFVLDLALSHGTELFGKHLWHYADLATFSTHSSKMLVTGEGGFVLTNRADLAEAVKRARHYGDRSEGVNYRLGGAQAALGFARLPYLANHVVHRRTLMEEISAALVNPHLEPLPILPGGRPAGVKLIVRERSGRGEALNEHLARAAIPSDIRIYNCRPLYQFPIFEHRRANCPNAASLLSSIATLPVHPDIHSIDRDHIIQTLNTYNPVGM